MAEARKEPGRQEAGTQEPRQAGMLAGRQANSQAGRQAGRKPTPADPPHSRLCIGVRKKAKMARYGGDSCRKKSQDGRLVGAT